MAHPGVGNGTSAPVNAGTTSRVGYRECRLTARAFGDEGTCNREAALGTGPLLASESILEGFRLSELFGHKRN
jgi:hypothetical protein